MLLLRKRRRTDDLFPTCSVFRLLQGSENSKVEGERSLSTVQTLVERGLALGPFLSRGILSRSARDVSHSRSSLSILPNRPRRRLSTAVLRGPCEVRRRISAFVTWSVARTLHSLLRHRWSGTWGKIFKLLYPPEHHKDNVNDRLNLDLWGSLRHHWHTYILCVMQ